MLKVENSIELRAPPWRVWKTLTRLDGYGRWHPFIRSAGDPTPGAHVDYIFRHTAFQRSFTAQARIVRNEEPTAFAWRMGVPGFLAIEETFEITPNERGSTLRHRMEGRGLVAYLSLRIVERRLRSLIVKTDIALDPHLRGAPTPPPRTGNRAKRRAALSRARHAPAKDLPGKDR